MKLSPIGNVDWYREVAGSIVAPLFGANDLARGIVEAADGSGYFVTGTVESDAYLTKLDAGGNTIRSVSRDGSNNAYRNENFGGRLSFAMNLPCT